MGFSRIGIPGILLLAALTAAVCPMVAAAPKEDLAGKVRAEAAKIGNVARTEFFEIVSGRSEKASVQLTKEQSEQTGRLYDLLVKVLEFGLLRGLDDKAPPSATELASRLSEQGKRERQVLVSEAESMVLEAILSRDQATRVRRSMARKPAPPLPGRYGAYGMRPFFADKSLEEVKYSVEYECQSLSLRGGTCSTLFQDVLSLEPDPKSTKEQRRLADCLGLSPTQRELISRLNQLSCDIRASLAKRGRADLSRRLDDGQFADPEAQANAWFGTWRKIVNGFVARSEILLLGGILTPRQSHDLLIYYWSHSGCLALLDPQFVSWLRLTRTQRDMIVEAFLEMPEQDEEIVLTSNLIETARGTDEFGRSLSDLARQRTKELKAGQQWSLWSILTPSQLKRLNQLLGTSISAPDAPPPRRRPGAEERRARE